MVTEIYESIKERLSEKLGSPMYWDFVIAWSIINWKYIYITFFVSEELILQERGMLKNEYLLLTLVPYTDSIQVYIIIVLWKFLFFPGLVAVFAIYFLSKLDFIIFRKVHSLKNEKKDEQYKQDKKLLESQKEVLVAEQERKEVENQIRESLSDEDLWDIEFNKSKSVPIFAAALNELRASVYEHEGQIHHHNWQFDPNYLSYVDVNDLIKMEDHLGSTKIIITPKGKYFLKKFIEE
jgi:hypothetical protein